MLAVAMEMAALMIVPGEAGLAWWERGAWALGVGGFGALFAFLVAGRRKYRSLVGVWLLFALASTLARLAALALMAG